MDSCPEDLAMYLREKALKDLTQVGKEADLYLLAHNRRLSDRYRSSVQTGARLKAESTRPTMAETSPRDRVGKKTFDFKEKPLTTKLCFKCKMPGHIARYCTASTTVTKKAGAGLMTERAATKAESRGDRRYPE